MHVSFDIPHWVITAGEYIGAAAIGGALALLFVGIAASREVGRWFGW